MKKKLTGLLAILLAASMALGGCSSNTETQSTEPSSGEEPTEQAESTEEPEDAESAESTEGKHEITDLVIPKTATRELQTFNILYSQLAADFENLCNLTEPLLEVDTYGALAPAIAEDWGTEDGGLTWTFNLPRRSQMGRHERQREGRLHLPRLCDLAGVGPQLPQERFCQYNHAARSD